MLVACRLHGTQLGVMISADLLGQFDKDSIPRIVDVLYECDGEIVWEFHVSEEFARQHELSDGTEPLPDQPGEWARDLQCCCRACFEEAHVGAFGDDHRWKPRAVRKL